MTISAGSACHSCSTQETTTVGASGGGVAAASRSTASVVSTVSLIAVAACSCATLHASETQRLADAQLGGRENLLDQREHVVAVARSART